MDNVYNSDVCVYIMDKIKELASEKNINQGSGSVRISKWALQQIAKELMFAWKEAGLSK